MPTPEPSAPARLAEALEKMTPGRWKPFVKGKFRAIQGAVMPNGHTAEIVQWGGFDASDIPLGEQADNVRGICLMRNELPALLSRLATAEAERDETQRHYELQCAGTMSRLQEIAGLRTSLATSEATAARLRERVTELTTALGDVVELADGAMRLANDDWAEYDRERELRAARALLSPVLTPPGPPREPPHGEAR